MVGITSLLLPVFVAAVLVFLVSFVMHMVLKYHRTDFNRIPSEDGVMDALRKFNIPEGDYVVPHAGSPEAMKSAEYLEKYKKGPVVVATFLKPGAPTMGASLVQWFLYCLLVGIFAAYVAGRALPPGAHYLAVFRFAGVTAFAGYGLALLQNSIWYKRKWSATMKSVFDALIYGLVTAGTFGWLWPSDGMMPGE
jgi:hypothetical protein